MSDYRTVRAPWLTALLAATCLSLPMAAARTPQSGSAELSEVRRLYEAAEFERALEEANRTDTATLTPGAARDVGVYGALCLLALGRQSEAEQRLEGVVRAQPTYVPGEDLPNRLRQLVTTVRNRLAPELALGHYSTGRDLFVAGDHQAAIAELETALRVTDLVSDAALPARSDIRTLASGFKDLAANAAARAAAGVPVPATSEVVAPLAVRQDLPPWPEPNPPPGRRPPTGVLEVVISNAGTVKKVQLLEHIDPAYDPILLTAAMDWQYLPATRGGLPIEYVKRLTIAVK